MEGFIIEKGELAANHKFVKRLLVLRWWNKNNISSCISILQV